MTGLSVELRRGETSDALVRRFLRKCRKDGLMDEIKHPINGCPQCRVISKKSLKKAYKAEQAERRRRREVWQKIKRQRKREASLDNGR